MGLRRRRLALRNLVDGFLRPVGRVLAEAGSVWVVLLPAGEPEGGATDDAAGTRAPGPPPGHPERLRPDVPLTPLELALRAELADPS